MAFDGQEHAAGGARLRNHGVSTTFIEGVRFMEPEYSPACLAFSPLARMTIRLVLVLRESVPLGCGAGNRSSSEWSNRPATPAFSGLPLPFG
jgi:hypothetical protein